MLHLLNQLIREPFGDYGEPVDIRARVLDDSSLDQALVVFRVQVAQLPVLPVALNLPELIVEMRGAEIFGGYQVTPVDPVRDVEEVPVLSHVLAEGHVRVKQAVDEAGPGLLVVDEGALDQVGG